MESLTAFPEVNMVGLLGAHGKPLCVLTVQRWIEAPLGESWQGGWARLLKVSALGKLFTGSWRRGPTFKGFYETAGVVKVLVFAFVSSLAAFLLLLLFLPFLVSWIHLGLRKPC